MSFFNKIFRREWTLCALSSLLSIILIDFSSSTGCSPCASFPLTFIQMFWFSCPVHSPQSSPCITRHLYPANSVVHSRPYSVGNYSAVHKSLFVMLFTSLSPLLHHHVLRHSNSVLTFIPNKSDVCGVSFVKPENVHNIHI